ncbi:MAG: hypothetical protein WD669_00685 [Pirellulales bacterium]
MAAVDFVKIVGNLVGAMTVVLYGVLAVWAVGSHWHWFVRTAVVGIALLAPLVFSAYDLTIDYALALTMFCAILTIWRRPAFHSLMQVDRPAAFRRWPRIALRDVFLLMIVAATVLTIIVRAPARSFADWLLAGVDAGVLAVMGFACTWLVLGVTSVRIRLAALPLVFAFCVFGTAMWLEFFSPNLERYFVVAFRWTFQKRMEDIWSRYWRFGWPGFTAQWAVSVAVGMAAFCAWLAFVIRPGWYASRPELVSAAKIGPRFVLGPWPGKRIAALAITVFIAALPLYVWGRLAMPRSLPPEAFKSDENYLELMRLADELYLASAGDANVWSSRASDAQFAALVARDQPIWIQLRAAIEQGCRFPWLIPDQNLTNEKLSFLAYLLSARAARGDGTAPIEPQIVACLDAIRLGELEHRSSSEYSGPFTNTGLEAVSELWNLRKKLASDQCAKIARELCRMEATREPREQFARRSRQILANSDWNLRVQLIAGDLSGVTHRFGTRDQRLALSLRILILELAIRAFELDSGQPPNELAQLMPQYVAALLDDPFSEEPFKYKRHESGYVLYSVGPNRRDDGGEFDAKNAVRDDFPVSRMFRAAAPRPMTANSSTP